MLHLMQNCAAGHQTRTTPQCVESDSMPMKTEAGKWLAEHDGKPKRLAHWKEPRRQGKNPMVAHCHALAIHYPAPRDFVEANRHIKTADCVFVPGARRGQPKQVSYLGKTISAARYMALLTFGTPKHHDAVARHLCGNGHLSCINPAHLEWGSRQDNDSDAGRHRGLETAQDKIHATAGPR
jgi:hypothetical protein